MELASKERLRQLAQGFATQASQNRPETAAQTLTSLLKTKCPFSKLDQLGTLIGTHAKNNPQTFLYAFDRVIDQGTMGGFVVVGEALVSVLEADFEAALHRSRSYIIKGNAWYVCDIIGERSIGKATVKYFDRTLPFLRCFLEDDNLWVKRSAGIAVHFFAKRVRDDPVKVSALLSLLEPYIEERRVDVVKGIGWGLKTIGRNYSDILSPFLVEQLSAKKNLSKLMLRKALKYLPADKKAEVLGHV